MSNVHSRAGEMHLLSFNLSLNGAIDFSVGLSVLQGTGHWRAASASG